MYRAIRSMMVTLVSHAQQSSKRSKNGFRNLTVSSPSWDGRIVRGSFIHHTWMPRRFLCLSQIFGIGNLGRKGRSQNVQVQAQGYLIRREDYIAVTRVGLGGMAGSESSKTGFLASRTSTLHYIDQEWLGIQFKSGNARRAVPRLHHS